MEHMNMRMRRLWGSSTLTSGIDRLDVLSPLRYPVWCEKRQTKTNQSCQLTL